MKAFLSILAVCCILAIASVAEAGWFGFSIGGGGNRGRNAPRVQNNFFGGGGNGGYGYGGGNRGAPRIQNNFFGNGGGYNSGNFGNGGYGQNFGAGGCNSGNFGGGYGNGFNQPLFDRFGNRVN